MHIQTLEFDISDFPSGSPLERGLTEATVNLDPRVNLLVGPNASGKSAILRLAAGLTQARQISDGSNRANTYVYEDENLRMSCIFEVSPDWPPAGRSRQIPEGAPLLHIPATRTSAAPADNWDEIPVTPGTEHIRLLAKLPARELVNWAIDTSGGVFRGQFIELARRKFVEEFPENLDEIQLSDQNRYEKFAQAMAAGIQCARDICDDVITLPSDLAREPGLMADRPEMEEEDIGKIDNSYDIMRGQIITRGRFNVPGMPFQTPGGDFRTRPLNQVSAGTGAVMAWTAALAFKMAQHHRWTSEWQSRPGILLLDELENQLHPAWQMRVIPALMRHFPGLQLIATTHSPFVALNREAGQIHRLHRTPEGDTGITQWAGNTFGWTSDQAARELFEVQTESGLAAEKDAQELNRLLAQGPRPAPAEEEERQQRLNALRNRINSRLLGDTAPQDGPGGLARN